MLPTQAFRSRSSGKVANIQTNVDPKTGERIVLWRDIQRAFKNAATLWKGNCILSFLTDQNLEEIVPLRISYYPDDVLEVDMKVTSRLHRLPSTHIRTFPVDECNTDQRPMDMIQDVQLIALGQNQSLHPSPEVFILRQTNPGLAIMRSINQRVDRLQVDNKELQEQLVHMQERLYEKQDRMFLMQQQALDRLVIIQSSVQALVTQTYELHEYPIPRLFIILPKTLGLTGKLKSLISDQFRLYFLCECGTHTMSEDTKTTHQIHLAKHEGYDLEKPSVFFERYGRYVLTLMQMIKYGITAAGIIVPPLATSRIIDGIETAQKHMDYLRKNIAPLVDDTIDFLSDTKFDNDMGDAVSPDPPRPNQLEALEGADLRQLESYLKIKDQGRVLGNLYRIVTSEGHVKWVCFDHYRATYREIAIKRLREIVEINRGMYIEETGRIEINLTTNILAREFYDVIIKARWVQELEITLGWDATMDDLREFAKAVTNANVVSLTVNGGCLKKPALDVVNRARRFDPIMQLASNARLQSLQIKGFDDFFARVSKSSLMSSPKLRVLSVQSELPLHDKVKSINGIIKHFSGLTTLEVMLNHRCSITNTTLDILKELPRLESLKVDCSTRTVAANVMGGKIQRVVLAIDRIIDLSLSDLEVIHDDYFSKLLIKYAPQDGHVNWLPEALQTPNFRRIEIMSRGGNCSGILAACGWKLRDLVEMGSTEFPQELASFSIECQRLSLASVTHADIRDTVMRIKRLSDLCSDDLAAVELGYIDRLEIIDTPLKPDGARLAQILKVNMASFHLQIGVKGVRPSVSTEHEIDLWDIVEMATSNTLCGIESLKIDYWKLSVTTGVYQGSIRDVVLTVELLSDVVVGDLDTIQWGTFPRLLIKYAPQQRGKDRLNTLVTEMFSCIYITYNDGHFLVILAASERKLQDLVDMATSETHIELASYSIDCQRLSLTADISQGNVHNMTIRRPTHLTSHDLAYIRHGHLTQLEIRRTPGDRDTRRLIDVLKHSKRLNHFEIRRGKEQVLPGSKNPGMKLLDLVKAFSTLIPQKIGTFLVNCQQFSLTISYSGNSTKEIVMTVVRLKDVLSDDLTYIHQGHITRLEIEEMPREVDRDRLINVLQHSKMLRGLEIRSRKEDDPIIDNAPEMNLLDLTTVVTSNALHMMQLFTFDCQRFSLTTSFSQKHTKDVVMTVVRIKDLLSDDLAYIHQGHITRLEIEEIPKEEDRDRLINVLQHSKMLRQLEIRCRKEDDPIIDNAPEMNLLDLTTAVTSNVLHMMQLFTVDCRRFSLATNFSRKHTKEVVMTVVRIKDLLSDDLTYIHQGHITRLEIEENPKDEDKDRLADILQHSKMLRRLEIRCHKEGDSTIDNMNFLDLTTAVTSNVLHMMELFTVDCRRFSLTTNFSRKHTREVVMTVVRIKDVLADDLTYIRHGHITRLEIEEIPRNEDKDRLAYVLWHSKKLDRLEIRYGKERDATIDNTSEMKLLDLETVVRSNAVNLSSFSLDYQRLSLASMGKSRYLEMTMKRIDGIDPSDLAFIKQGRLSRLVLLQPPKVGDVDRLASVISLSNMLEQFEIKYGGGDSIAVGQSPEMNLENLTMIVTAFAPLMLQSFSVDYRRLSLTVTGFHHSSERVMTIGRLDSLSPDDLTYIQLGHLTRLVIRQIPKVEDRDLLIKVLRHNQNLNQLEIMYNAEQDPATGKPPEMNFWGLVKTVKSSLQMLKSFSIKCPRLSLTMRYSETKDITLTIGRVSDLHPDAVTYIRRHRLTRLVIKQTPRDGDRDQLTDVLLQLQKLKQLEIRSEEEKDTPIGDSPEMKLLDLMAIIALSSPKLRSFRIDYRKLSLAGIVSHNKICDFVLTVNHLSDLRPVGLAVMDHCNTIQLVVLNTPQRDDKDCLAQVFQRKMAHLHLRIGHKGEQSSTQNTKHEIPPQDIVNAVTSSIHCKTKSLVIEDWRASVATSTSDGAAQNVGMAITSLSGLSADNPVLTQQSLSRLTIMRIHQEEDDDRLMDIIRESTSLEYLQVGCNGDRSFSLVDRVVSTRKFILQARGSCSLRTFELTENNLSPFDVLADCDSDFHIQTHISFPEDRTPFNMRTWIRFGSVVDIEDNHPVHRFIRRYGWSFVFVDGCTINENTFQTIMGNNTTTTRSQLETLVVSNYSATFETSHLEKVIKRSPNFQDLGLCIQFGNFRDITAARLLISQYGTVLSRLQLSGGAPSQWSRITSCFAKRSSFPSLQSFELQPSFKFPSEFNSWVIIMASAPPGGFTPSYPYFPSDAVDEQKTYGQRTGSWTPLRKIGLRQVVLDPEEWRWVIEAIDFSVLEYLDLQSSNFSLEQMKLLVDRISDQGMFKSPLKTLNIAYTRLPEETESWSLERMVLMLREKPPSIIID